MNCIYCNGTNVVKHGYSRNGTRVWKCKDCKITFQDSYVPTRPLPEGLKCPTCGSTAMTRYGKDPSGLAVYRCKACRHQYRPDSTHAKFKNTEGLKCPTCGSMQLRKDGHTRDGHQQYYCKTCNHKYSPYSSKRPLSNSDKNLIIRYYLAGVPMTELAKYVNRSYSTVVTFIYRWKAQYKEKQNADR